VSYEELRSDPAGVAGELFRWLGVDASEETLDTVRNLSRERFSELGVVPETDDSQLSTARRARRLAREALSRAGRRLVPREEPEGSENAALAFHFVAALRSCDEQALRAMTAESLVLAYRSADGDICSHGEEAREALAGIARQAFSRHYVGEWWATAPGGPREWWSRAPGQPFWTIFFSALGGDATRVDLAFGLTPEDGVIANVVVVSAGSPAGRPLRQLDLRPVEAEVPSPTG
jgi:hypothetical protein